MTTPSDTPTPDAVLRERALKTALETRGSYDAPGFDACVNAEYNRLLATPDAVEGGEKLTEADYYAAMQSTLALVRRLDVAMNGEEGAAKQAMLCDIVHPLETIIANEKRLRASLPGEISEQIAEIRKCPEVITQADILLHKLQERVSSLTWSNANNFSVAFDNSRKEALQIIEELQSQLSTASNAGDVTEDGNE